MSGGSKPVWHASGGRKSNALFNKFMPMAMSTPHSASSATWRPAWLKNLEQDIIFMDPPWGGVDYEVLGKNGYDLKKNMRIRVDPEDELEEDTTPPTVNIMTPTNNSEVSDIVTIQITANDENDISFVQVYSSCCGLLGNASLTSGSVYEYK